MNEGKMVCILPTGYHSTKATTIDRLYCFIETEGLQKNEKHPEMYLSDPDKIAQEKMKTLLRSPAK